MGNREFWAGILAGIMIGFLLAFIWAANIATPNHVWRKDAYDHGAAKWTIDPETGERSFEWVGKE